MRSEEEMIKSILHVAADNNNIRTVLLTGSRANPNAAKDELQDYDIIYIVTQLDAFTTNHSWVDVFGERLIMQLPDEMTIGEKDQYAFHYLLLFKDSNRLDLTLLPLNKLTHLLKSESLLRVLMDKDNGLLMLPAASERNYLISPPAGQQFADCCNEFWWVSTYVAKGLCRKEITYAKAMMEGPVRTMFLQMIEWHIGVHTRFAVSFGKSGRNMQRYLSSGLYTQILATYADSTIENNWHALFGMTCLFDTLAKEVAAAMHFSYNGEEAVNVTGYLKQLYTSQINALK